MIEVSLTICRPEGTPEEAALTEGCLCIGLNDNTGIVILNDEASAEPHARICRDEAQTWIEDKTGISHLNGDPIQPAERATLSDGDEIIIGNSRINVHIQNQASSVSEATGAGNDQAGSRLSAKYFRATPKRTALLAMSLLLLLLIGLTGLYAWKNRKTSSLFRLPSSDKAISPVANAYKQAIQKVEQDRGEPMGRQAEIDIPVELKHYKDRRRFLALQVAEWRKQKYEIPHDFAELASMIQKGELTRLPTLGESYLLYGVGIKANDELTHYDQKTGKSVPLFSSEAELEKERGQLADSLKELETRSHDLKKDLEKSDKRDRATRARLQDQITETQKSASDIKKRRELIDSFYESEDHRKLMVAEYETLAGLARDFDGRVFDLNDPSSRKEFKIRLLSYLRPPALARLEEIALAYQQKFDRPLPITSLVRTEEYQRYLGDAGNPNAIRIQVPPHTTGLAFDVFTHYMAADEQNFLMAEIARLEREGRVEALRENRDHIHVFAYADGVPPDESLVKKSASLATTQD